MVGASVHGEVYCSCVRFVLDPYKCSINTALDNSPQLTICNPHVKLLHISIKYRLVKRNGRDSIMVERRRCKFSGAPVSDKRPSQAKESLRYSIPGELFYQNNLDEKTPKGQPSSIGSMLLNVFR